MKQSLHLKLSQQLTLTPQLKQSLRLLQLPSLDLEHEIQQALDSNPLLERVENTDNSSLSGEGENTPAQTMDEIGEASDSGFEIERNDYLAPEQDLSSSWTEAFESRRTTSSSSNSSSTSNGASGSDVEFTQFATQQESLFEHIDWQVKMTTLSPKDQNIATAILHCLDQDGYLTLAPEDMVAMMSIESDVDTDEVNAVLSLIKTLDPIGVGAANLQERLLILLKQPSNCSHPNNELACIIVEKHLDLVSTHNLAKLKKALSISQDELSNALELVTSLNPRITAQFTSDNENYVIPDLTVKKVADQWVAQVNAENQCRLRVNETYSDLLSSAKNLDKESNEFIQQNLAQAKVFIKSLMSRYDTLQLVGQAIVERQQNFFEHGETAMQPMVLQDIASVLDMHESTISRATSGKYLHSPKGVFELKYFFSSAVSTTDGAASSSTAIRSLIKKMIDDESKAKPLSDSKIAKELEQQGHIVARRTVAKYRESMQIAPSSQRKSLVG